MILATERLLLREISLDDWPAVLAYQSDPLYLRYYTWKGRAPDEVQQFVTMLVNYQHEQPRYRFQLAITRRGAPEMIGNCGLRKLRPEADEAELGYELAPAVWGQGYATEAARAMLEWGFQELGLRRVSARCLAENTASARVLEKLGLRLEARLERNQFFKDRWWDELVYVTP